MSWRDDKKLEICTVGLEFESGRTPLVRTWDNWSFTCSSGPIKYAFRGSVFSNPKISLVRDYSSLILNLILNLKKRWNLIEKIATDDLNVMIVFELPEKKKKLLYYFVRLLAYVICQRVWIVDHKLPFHQQKHHCDLY